MIIACLPSETTFDVQCPMCGRGFLFLTDSADSDRAALRRAASTALAAQHNKLMPRSDRRRGADRRSGQPDPRKYRVERRSSADRRDSDPDRRGKEPERRGTAGERRSTSPTFRRGSGAAHPREIFYLQGCNEEVERTSRSWANGLQVQPGARC